MTIEELKQLKESENKVEFKEASNGIRNRSNEKKG